MSNEDRELEKNTVQDDIEDARDTLRSLSNSIERIVEKEEHEKWMRKQQKLGVERELERHELTLKELVTVNAHRARVEKLLTDKNDILRRIANALEEKR